MNPPPSIDRARLIAERNRICAKVVTQYKEKLPKHEAHAFGLWVDFFPPFQRRWMFEQSRFAAANKSRQIGFSHSSAATSVLWGVWLGETTTIISKGQKESNNVLELARRHAKALRQAGSTAAKLVRQSTEFLQFDSGGRIISLPSDGGRSYSGNVMLDEFAYQAHAKDVWDAAAPVALLGHKMRVLSTPNGVGNEFHDLWEYITNPEKAKRTLAHASKAKWVGHEVPLSDAMAEGFVVDMDAAWELAKGDPRIFAQMFECSFLDAEFQYVPTDAIERCLVATPLDPLEQQRGDFDYYAGLDIGREVDLTCLLVIRRHKRTGKCRIVHVEVMRRTDSDGLDEMVASAFARFKLRRLCIDQTGLGSFPAERIKKKHSERYDVDYRRPKVEPLDFTPTLKEQLATGLYTAATTHVLELPGSDAALPPSTRLRENGTLTMVNEAGTWKYIHREIASLMRKVTKSANVVYETPRTREGHGDRAWALMLALHARDPIHPMVLAMTR